MSFAALQSVVGIVPTQQTTKSPNILKGLGWSRVYSPEFTNMTLEYPAISIGNTSSFMVGFLLSCYNFFLSPFHRSLQPGGSSQRDSTAGGFERLHQGAAAKGKK